MHSQSGRLLISLYLLMLLSLEAKKPNIIVIFTDDHGYADLSCQGTEPDIRTPHLDRMAKEGVRFTDGYVTAPQCCPSRAGLLAGRDQNRFGHIANGYGPLPLSEKTIADHLGAAGYMIGKWHLDPNPADKSFLARNGITNKKVPAALKAPYHPHARGFQETFYGPKNSYSVTYDLKKGRFEEPKNIRIEGDRVDIQSAAAARFIDLHHDKPFFLYLSYFAPHVPLTSSKKYLDRFPGEMPTRRRLALAMISSVDDGVGKVMERLSHYGIDQDTILFFIGDNGAPIKLVMEDKPGVGPGWDGSKNTPLNGEKGMLAEGGIRVPWLMRWKGTIPGGQVSSTPVTSLDVASTSVAAAGIFKPDVLEGENLLPMLVDDKDLPERTLFWRFWIQSAIRKGDWKMLQIGNRKSCLFNLADDKEEQKDLSAKHPDILAELQKELAEWGSDLTPKGIPDGPGNWQEQSFYEHFFDVPADANNRTVR